MHPTTGSRLLPVVLGALVGAAAGFLLVHAVAWFLAAFITSRNVGMGTATTMVLVAVCALAGGVAQLLRRPRY